jgi:hypothetical protein
MKRNYLMVLIGFFVCSLFTFTASGDPNLGPFINDAETLLLYHMDETSGTSILDSSSAARHGEMSADLAAQAGNRIAGQTGFDNAIYIEQAVSKSRSVDWSDSINAMPLGDSNEFTIEAWINPTGFAANEYLFAFGPGIGSAVSLRWDPTLVSNATSIDELNVVTYSLGSYQDETITLSDTLQAGIWQHLALIYKETDATNARYEIYKNGIMIGSLNIAYQIENNAEEMHIGHIPAGAWYQQYRGEIDEFRVSLGARDWTIPQVPLPELGPFFDDADTMLLYHVDEPNGATIIDASSEARNGEMSADLAAQAGNRIVGKAGFGNAVHFIQGVTTQTRIDWADEYNPIPLLSNGVFTVEAWIKPTGFAAEEYLFTLGANYGTTLSIRWDPTLTSNVTSLDRLTVGAGITDANILLSDPLQAGVWQHLALIYTETDPTNSRYDLYKNGLLVGSEVLNYHILSNPAEIHIGGYPGIVWYRQYRGDVDEFRISGIARDWTTAPTPPVTVGLYRFDTMFDDDDAPDGEYVVDDSGNDLHIKRYIGNGNFRPSLDISTLAPSGSLSLESGGGSETLSTDLFSIGRTGELTIEFWYKPLSGTSINYILNQIDITSPYNDNNSWDIYQTVPNGGNWKLAFGTKDDSGVLQTVFTPEIFNTSTGWCHIAVTVSQSGFAKIYKDGVVIASQSGITNFVSKSFPLALSGDDLYNFAGTFLIDDLRITDRVLGPGLGSGVGELAWNVSLSNAPVKYLRPADLAKQWLRTHPMMISSWAAVGGDSPADWTKYTDANFNATLSSRSGFQATIAAGVASHDIGGIRGIDGDALKTIHINSNISNLEGWLLGDEIPEPNIAEYAEVADYIRTIDPNRIIYAGLGSSGEPYIDSIVNTIEPDAVIHGWYPFANPAVLPGIDFMDGHYTELEIIRRKALEYGLPYFYYIQSFADHDGGTPYRYLPSESQLRFDLFTKLAFGVKGFIYYVFDFTQGGSLIDDALYNSNTNTTSALYAPAVTANAEVLNLGNSLRFLESTDVRFVKGQPANPAPTALTLWTAGAGGDTHLQNIQIVEQGTGKDALIGFFEDDAGQKYFMLTNVYQDQALSAAAATLNFNLTFDASVSTVWRLRRDTGVAEALTVPGSHILNISLPGGTGDLFKYDDGDFAITGCADPSHAYPTGDLTGDCRVNFLDFSVLAYNWLDEACQTPYWCENADMDMNETVTTDDLNQIVENWLECTDLLQSCN